MIQLIMLFLALATAVKGPSLFSVHYFSQIINGQILKCLKDSPDMTLYTPSRVTCVFACIYFRSPRCRRIQYYTKIKRCEIFFTWNPFSTSIYDPSTTLFHVGPCYIYQDADSCPKSFFYIPNAGVCYKLEVGQMNWNSAQSHCNKMGSFIYPAVLNGSVRNDAVKDYLRHVNDDPTYKTCFLYDYDLTLKIWTAGQTQNPTDNSSPYMWKPFKNVNLPMTSFEGWDIFQPSKLNVLNLAMVKENCLTITMFTYGWNDAVCSRLKCVVCQANPGDKIG